MPGEKEIFQFTGEVIENKNKIADIGLMILEDAVFYEINKTYKPVDLNNMMINGEGNNEYDEFFVAGYPKAKNSYRQQYKNPGFFKNYPRKLFTHEAEDFVYKRFKEFDRNNHLIVSHTNTKNNARKKIKLSHPGGLSGSGFWGLNRKTKSYELCGIGTDYRPKAHPTHLVAVRFKLLVFFIHQRLKSNVDKYD